MAVSKIDVYFPVQYSSGDSPDDGLKGPPVVDAGTLYVTRSDGVGHELMSSTTLDELVDDFIDGAVVGDSEVLDADDVLPAQRLIEALRAAANKLESHLPTAKRDARSHQ